MRNKIFILFSILILVFVSFVFHQKDHKDQVTISTKNSPLPIREPSSVIKNEVAASEDKNPSQEKSLRANKREAKRFIKKVNPSSFEFHHSFSNDVHLISNVVAITKKNYEVSMGDIVHQDLSYHYIKGDLSLKDAKLSVYDSKKQKLAPLSSIIKLSDVDESLRDHILSLGFKENLYFKDFNLLFIETNTSDYLEIYEALIEKGFKPEHQELTPMLEGK